MMDKKSLAVLPLEAVKEIAKTLSISGRTSMNRRSLETAIMREIKKKPAEAGWIEKIILGWASFEKKDANTQTRKSGDLLKGEPALLEVPHSVHVPLPPSRSKATSPKQSTAQTKTSPRSAKEIRERFLSYFQERGHALVASSSLVPADDPTLLFTNAGMVQFKDFFAGVRQAPYEMAVSCQRCVRAGGKHNDLENVGFTPRHHTLFEMLGNFSFGAYFKREAIAYAWDFLTSELGIDKQRLWVTVFAGEDGIPADEEAFAIWTQEMGVPAERVQRLGSKENFWAMGDTGPCGPCSEIHYDRGVQYDPPGVDSTPADDTGRYVEVWNLVFMQFNRQENGEYKPLPKPAIDTGMGLERIAMALRDLPSNYETDAFMPLIDVIARGVSKEYRQDENDSVSMRVVADHARSTAFLIADGVLPSNEGRGYVLRRIMRRAIRHGDRLGYKELFFHRVCEEVVREMAEIYPQLQQQQRIIIEAVQREEERFRKTLERGLKLLEEEMAQLQKSGVTEIPGDVLFRLYDTHGFPPDLTRVIGAENGFSSDEEGFERCMKEQQESGLASWKGADTHSQELYQDVFKEIGPTRFLGYEAESAQATIRALVSEGERVAEATQGQSVTLFFEQTPFYGESGGQVGDHGMITTESATIRITDTQKPLADLFAHTGEVVTGTVKLGQVATLEVDHARRSEIRRNHSATHLLHWALRKHLGDHVRQAGSLVSPERLRFDFAHHEAITSEELRQIEQDVNLLIRENAVAQTEVVGFEEAKQAGAMALFGEKYGDNVRMVRIGPTLELCGGTHVQRSGDIGQLRVVSEQGIQAGVRRIEAITGIAADQQSRGWFEQLQMLSSMLRCRVEEVPERIEKMQQQVKTLQKEVDRLKLKAAQAGQNQSDPLSQAQEIAGIKVLSLRTELDDPKAIRDLADQFLARLKSGVVILGGAQKDKAALCVMVSKDLQTRLSAGKIVSPLASLLGGKGGGRPDMAQGGGPDVARLDEVLQQAPQQLADMLQA